MSKVNGYNAYQNNYYDNSVRKKIRIRQLRLTLREKQTAPLKPAAVYN